MKKHEKVKPNNLHTQTNITKKKEIHEFPHVTEDFGPIFKVCGSKCAPKN